MVLVTGCSSPSAKLAPLTLAKPAMPSRYSIRIEGALTASAARSPAISVSQAVQRRHLVSRNDESAQRGFAVIDVLLGAFGLCERVALGRQLFGGSAGLRRPHQLGDQVARVAFCLLRPQHGCRRVIIGFCGHALAFDRRVAPAFGVTMLIV
ncbi:MAG: hypothetical protein WDN69_03425 [Aliidongia sp.]